MLGHLIIRRTANMSTHPHTKQSGSTNHNRNVHPIAMTCGIITKPGTCVNQVVAHVIFIVIAI